VVREQEIHQETIKNENKIHAQIDEKSMLNPCSKKRCQNDGNMCQTGALSISHENACRK
jgi:hypothetical protein